MKMHKEIIAEAVREIRRWADREPSVDNTIKYVPVKYNLTLK